MATFNSSKQGRRVFKPTRTAAADPTRNLKILYRRIGNIRHIVHAQDPEYRTVNVAAAIMARHYLFGCKNCGAAPKKPRDITPDAKRLLGIRVASNGEIHYPGDNCSKKPGGAHMTSLLGGQMNLSDLLSRDVRTRGGVFVGKLKEAFWDPTKIIGTREDGGPAYSGDSMDRNGKVTGFDPSRMQEEFPKELIELAADTRARANTRLLAQGVTDPAEYFKVHKVVSHLEHGAWEETPSGLSVPSSARTEFTDLNSGEKPLNTHWKLKNWFRNIAHYVTHVGDLSRGRLESQDGSTEAAEGLRQGVENSDWVGCHCPACALSRVLTTEHSYFDVQHQSEAWDHPEPELRAAFRCAYPVDFYPGLGRISDLGPQGKKTPHRVFIGSRSYETYLHHIVNGRLEAANKEIFSSEPAVEPQEKIDPAIMRSMIGELNE